MPRIPPTLLALLVPAALAAQAKAPAKIAIVYRGFAPGMKYRDFAERARVLAARDTLRCSTSANTAQLMECGVRIRDASDGARFYLSAYVIEGKVAMVSLGDSGDARLLERSKSDLVRRLGPARTSVGGTWQWQNERRVARLSWRGKGAARWIYINLTDYDLMDGISRYVRRSRR